MWFSHRRAAPVGLFLACELRLAGVSALVLERAEDPHSPFKGMSFGLCGLTMPTVEPWTGAAWRTVAAGGPQPRRQAGHFAGIPLDERNVDAARWTHRLPGRARVNGAVELARVEAVLAARAVALGAEIRRGVAMESYGQGSDAVTVRAGSRSVGVRWLVGCDGERSAVRKAGGFAFVGTEPDTKGYRAEVGIAGPETLAPGRGPTPTGFCFQPRPGHLSPLEFDGGAFHRSGPNTREHLRAVLRRISGTPWTFGWTLAATVRGEAPDGLLDSYGAERHPIGARVLDRSRAQVAVMRPIPQARGGIPAIAVTHLRTSDFDLRSCVVDFDHAHR